MKQILPFLLLSFLISGTTDFAFANNKPQDPVLQFWTWFQLNEKRLKNYPEDPQRYLLEIQTHSKRIVDGLAIELELPIEGIRHMTFSADGNIDLFPIVKEIVQKAPPLAGWKFIAFRQRINSTTANEIAIEVGDINLEVKEMKFFPVVEGDSVDVIIYAKGITEENYMEMAYASLNLLDNLLGEYDCVMKVRNYDFHPMPTDKKEIEELQPLINLPGFIDSFHLNRKEK